MCRVDTALFFPSLHRINSPLSEFCPLPLLRCLGWWPPEKNLTGFSPFYSNFLWFRVYFLRSRLTQCKGGRCWWWYHWLPYDRCFLSFLMVPVSLLFFTQAVHVRISKGPRLCSPSYTVHPLDDLTQAMAYHFFVGHSFATILKLEFSIAFWKSHVIAFSFIYSSSQQMFIECHWNMSKII